MPDSHEGLEGWAVLELMGHRRLGGYVREQEVAGAAFVRIDVPAPLDENLTAVVARAVATVEATQFYSPAAVYCITPTTETMARAVAEGNRPQPVSEWELRRQLEPARVEPDESGDVNSDTIPF